MGSPEDARLLPETPKSGRRVRTRQTFRNRTRQTFRNSQELRLLWLIEQVRLRRLGIGKAASLAELPRAAFMKVLGEHGVPTIDYEVEDFDRELGVLGLE